MIRFVGIALLLCAFAPRVADAQAPATPEPTSVVEEEREDAEPEASADAEADADTGDLEALLSESVVTTASRSAERSSTAPASVMTITRADLERYGMRSLDEALRFLTLGLNVTETGATWRAPIQVGARGILLADSGRHVLLLVDGHVINSQSSGNAALGADASVPFEAIDHIEVMLGPASVVYGSNAMFAVVHVFTRRPSGTTLVHASIRSWASLPIDEDRSLRLPGRGRTLGVGARISISTGGRFELGGHEGEAVLHAEYYDDLGASFEVGPEEGSYFERPAGETVWGGRVHAHQRVANVAGSARLGDFRLAVQVGYATRTQPLTGLLGYPGTGQRTPTFRADLKHEGDPTDRWHVQTRLYGDVVYYREQSAWANAYYCAPGQIDGCIYRARDLGRSAGLEHVSTIDWGLDSRYVTTIGSDLRVRYGRGRPADYADLNDGTPPLALALPYYANVTFVGALFAQQLVQPTPAFGLNVGARLDVDSLFGARLSPRIAIVGQPHTSTILRVAYTEAFRGPSIAEVREYDPAYRVRAQNLRPEIVRNVEAEARLRFSRGYVALTGFASFYKDLVDSRYISDAEAMAAIARGVLSPLALPGYSVQYDNIGDVRVLGGSVAAEVRAGRGITLHGTFMLTDTRYESDGELDSLDMIPAWTGTARIEKSFGESGVVLALASQFYGRSAPQYGDGYDITSSAQCEVRGTVSGRFAANRRFGWQASTSFRVNPDNPVVISPGPLPDAPGNRVELVPNQRFHLLVGFSYDIDD